MGYKRRPELLTLVTSYEDCTVEVSKSEYLSITEGFMKFISDRILDGIRVKLPVNMGMLYVFGRKQVITIGKDGKPRGLAPDWKSTKALWEKDPEAKKNKTIIKFFNEHSGGIRYKFGWATTDIPLIFKDLFAFKATRENKRRLWKLIMAEKEYEIAKPLKKTKK